MKPYVKKADMLTFLNISLGFTAMVFILTNEFSMAARFILAAVVADGFDGYIARRSNTESEFGMNFDSLSDCISFGVAPALLVYAYVSQWWIIVFSVVYLAAGVLRLARYNVTFNKVEEGTFIGMPIPVGALLVVLAVFGDFPALLVVAAVVFVSYLMVCSILFTKIKTNRFPVQNLGILLLAAVPAAYALPVARIAFIAFMGGFFMRKKRSSLGE
jgi:CDP-diacylglycerol--serine O-phosphatidyltransferase